MPGLKNICSDNEYCCICEENDCSITLSPRATTILFADGEEIITSGPRCDCIMVLKRNNGAIEIYSIELKGISRANSYSSRRAYDPNLHREKCRSCLESARIIVENFNSIRGNPLLNSINKYCVIVIPGESIRYIATLIRREKRRFKPNISDDIRVLLCGSTITGQAVL